MKLTKLKASKGFTILELIISITIIALLSAGVGIELVAYQRAVALEGTAKDIVNTLRLARTKAIAGEDGNSPADGRGDSWGVRFSNGTRQTYAEFFGTAFNSANVTATTTLSSAAVFTNPSASTNKDIIFTKITGTTTPTTITISNTGSSQTRTITITTSTISY